MIGETEDVVKKEIESMEHDNTILGYRTVVNPERAQENKVACLIESSVQPEREHGFDKIAERILSFSEAQSVFLVSGGTICWW